MRPVTARKPPLISLKTAFSVPSSAPVNWYSSTASSLFSLSDLMLSSLKLTWSELAGPVRSTSFASMGEPKARRTSRPSRTADVLPADMITRPTGAAQAATAAAAKAVPTMTLVRLMASHLT